MSISIRLLVNLINNATDKQSVAYNSIGKYHKISGENYHILLCYNVQEIAVSGGYCAYRDVTLKIYGACWAGQVWTTNFKFGTENRVNLDDNTCVFLGGIKKPFEFTNHHDITEDQLEQVMLVLLRYT